MKAPLIGLVVAVAVATSANAQTKAPSNPTAIVLHNAATPLLTIYAWERNGQFINAPEGSGKEIPYDAAKNQVKLMNFPTASVRELRFEAGSRTHPHINREDIINYSVGARRVQIVNDYSHQIDPGDASMHQAGVNHHAETLRTGIQIEIAFKAPMKDDARTVWLDGKDHPLEQIVEGATRYQVKRFDLPGYPFEELHLPKGATTRAITPARDLIGYVVRGKVKVTVGGRSEVAEAGDAIRAPAGQPYGRLAVEDTVIVEALAPTFAMKTPGY